MKNKSDAKVLLHESGNKKLCIPSYLPTTAYGNTLDIILDTGASISIISAEFAKHISSAVRRGKPLKICNTSGEDMGHNGESLVKIKLSSIEFEWNLHVVQRTKYPLILGLDGSVNSASILISKET